MTRVILGDALEKLKDIESETIQTCITSPPYYNLRDYGISEWDGGNVECDHVANPKATKVFGNSEFNINRPSRENTKTKGYYYNGVCEKCGAIQNKTQLGLEDTPEEYIDNLVKIFEEVKRVLRDNGTLWVVIGDCYNGSGGAGGDYNEGGLREGQPRYGRKNVVTLKPKDLIGIPFLLAFALRDNGWYWRSDIVLSKRNPMPESVKDRPTRCHEYIMLFAKNRIYYYDNDAIKEPVSEAMLAAAKRGPRKDKQYKHDNHNRFGKRSGNRAFSDAKSLANIAEKGRNKRDVWTVTTKPNPDAHFATFNPDWIEPCILAGSPRSKKSIVLDPFCGTGVTGQVALSNGRDFLGIEINEKYYNMTLKNISCVQESLF